MAYNPFNIFRRNQRVIFAVITVIIMFIFTLSSGVMGGDFFENFSQWLGNRGKRGDALCTIDGTKVYERDVRQVAHNRQMANQYMSMLAEYTARQLDAAVRDQLPRLSPEARNALSQALQMEANLGQFIQMGLGAEIPRLMANIRTGVQRIADSPTATPEDKEAARNKLFAFILTDAIRQGGNYFAFAPNRTTRQRIEFMLWQKKADQLGIHFSSDDVRRLVLLELGERLTDKVQEEVQDRLRSDMQNFSITTCLQAVGEEFRVRTAQVAVLGPDVHGGRGDKTYGGFPMFNPPYEAFAFYREYCSPTSYAVIPVPAANLLAEVERRMALPPGSPERIDEPTENELKTLYDKYKDAMYSPDRETPGFKIPPRIRLEWFKITGEEPYYKAEAEKALRNEALLASLQAVTAAKVYGPPPGLVAVVSRSFVEDPLLARRYAETIEKHHRDQALRYGSAEVDFMSGPLGMPPMASSVVRPHNLAVAAAGMGGQLAGFGNTLGGLSVTVAGPMAFEARDRVRIGMPAVLGMIAPASGLFNTAVGGAAAYHTMLPKPLPVESYRGEFLQTLAAEKAKEIAFGNGRFDDGRVAGDVETFTEEVAKLSEQGRARDLGPAQKYIAEFVAKRGLKLEGNKTPRTEFDLEDDPELAPLVAAQKASLTDRNSPHRSDYTPFGRSFFWRPGTQTPISGRYVPQQYPPSARGESDAAKFVVWRNEEIAPTPVNYIAAKDAVKDAWKRAKARELAKAKADAVAAGIRAHAKAIEDGKAKVDEVNLLPYLRDEAEKLRAAAPPDARSQRRAQPFPIRGVAPLTSLTGNPAGEAGLPTFSTFDSPLLPGPVQPFGLPPSENIKYPSPADFRVLMEDRTKPPGTVMVIPDAPKDTFFVATLIKRDEKTEDQFLTQVANGRLSDSLGGPTIMAAFREQSSFATFLSVRALLKQEFNYAETEEQKKRLDENETRGGDN